MVRGKAAGTRVKEPMEECPIYAFLSWAKSRRAKKPHFWEHMANARIEFLEGIKSLIEDRIEYLKRQKEEVGKKGPTKIEVEE
ncbi:MAG: hypothetical protein DRG50_08155 [Deltaproteobacteria bacterium]|nr:MAG: hypothetical protein DRG50_08155 [Deltaproteobacteria bacterium]